MLICTKDIAYKAREMIFSVSNSGDENLETLLLRNGWQQSVISISVDQFVGVTSARYVDSPISRAI